MTPIGRSVEIVLNGIDRRIPSCKNGPQTQLTKMADANLPERRATLPVRWRSRAVRSHAMGGRGATSFLFYQLLWTMININAYSLVILLLVVAPAQCCTGFCIHPGSRSHTRALSSHHVMHKPYDRRLPRRHMSSDDDDNEKKPNDKGDGNKKKPDDKSYTWEEIQADPELRKMEFDSSMNRKNKIFLPARISQAVTTLGWMFVIGGIILNQLGYAWVKDPSGGIGVGTLDERNFQREVMKEGRMAKDDGEKTPALSVSKIADKHQFNWLEQQQQDSRSG
ncbi:hypothetical protein ACHAXR_011531 [Thalassiosira sp. AJA248-18]